MTMKQKIQIGEQTLGPDGPPFVVAEISANHNGSLERALGLVEEAAKAGAQAVKLQTYTADTMTLESDSTDFLIDDPRSLWHGRRLYDLYREASTPWEWHARIFDRCRELDMVGFSTPFDESAVEFLETLEVPCYKIASFELTDLPLIRKVGSTGKPVILSTGMGTVPEIQEAVDTARAAGARDLVLLRCTSEYPALPEHADLRTLQDMSRLFQCPVGISDHSLGLGVSLAAVVLGAVMIERHFTLGRSDGGPDAAFSLEPAELAALVREARTARKALGCVRYGPVNGESTSYSHRRSIYAVTDIAEGEVFTRDNIRVIRPGFGLSPKHFERLLRCEAAKRVPGGTALGWDVVKGYQGQKVYGW
jgi:pseudaminic acid synthase